MGNHEHYHGVFENTANALKKFLKDSPVKFLEKESVDLGDDTVLWGATLWTSMRDANPLNVEAAKYGMNDYRLIKTLISNVDPYKIYNTLHPATTVGDHIVALEALQTFLDGNKDKKVVVMTHMAPSSKSCHPRFDMNDPLNWSYFSELSEFILNNPQIKVWVHGHTHDSHDYMVGSTRVICNPRGYANSPDRQENEKFDINKTFEV